MTIPWEWQLTKEGRWLPVDPVEEFERLAEESRELVQQNRQHLSQAHALCARVRRTLRQQRAWKVLLAAGPAVH